MKLAFKLAEIAFSNGEVPVGAVVVRRSDGLIVGFGTNSRERHKNPMAHAEIAAINMAAENLKSWRLSDCDLYVTLQPCVMCLGAAINARIDNIYYGCNDKNFSVSRLAENIPVSAYNHKPFITGGIMENECSNLLSEFFRHIRRINKFFGGSAMVNIGNDWDEILKGEFDKEYYQNLRKFLANEYKTHTIYPDMYDIFNALKFTPYNDVKAVIIGQDPYHGPNQAHGLCFSVKKGVAVPPSLVNIFKEIKSDTGIDNLGKHGQLTHWAKQGVLMLNTVLTVRAGQANSHKNMGWEIFTDRVIELLNQRQKPIAFILWGGNAKTKARLITNPIHGVFTAAHPSPLSAYNGFFGCRHFSAVNGFLNQNGIAPIDWSID